MKLSTLSFFDLASHRLDWLSARQKTISQNIANANTPGARAEDIQSFDEYLAEAAAPAGTGTSAKAPKVLRIGDSWTQSPDGNNVSLEQQTILATQTASEHRLASRLYAKGHELLILAGS